MDNWNKNNATCYYKTIICGYSDHLKLHRIYVTQDVMYLILIPIFNNFKQIIV